MMESAPTPADLLEELANRVIAHINESSEMRFDEALDEMVDYHRFLLEAYSTRSTEGEPFSYAEVGGFFMQPHHEWIRQYRRLFERGARAIGDSTHFIDTLAHVPARLIPDGKRVSPRIVDALLRLGPTLANRLEDWFTRRTILQNAPGQEASPRLALAGSDRKAYEGVVTNFVGAWETLISLADSLYHWSDPLAKREDLWKSLAESWHYVLNHLHDSGYLLAISVWNEDEVGADLYCDALIRWPGGLSYELPDNIYFRDRTFLYSDVLQLDWKEALARVDAIHLGRGFSPEPKSVFANLLRGAHDDALLLLAGLMLFWSIEQRQTTDIATRTCERLLNRRVSDPNSGSRLRSEGGDFETQLLDTIRILMSEDTTYGASLEQFVQSVDGMSERRVVPGRVYSPSTLQRAEDLFLPLVSILVARIPSTQKNLTSLSTIAASENLLPDGDATLRRMVRALSQMIDLLTTHHPKLHRAVELLSPNEDVRERTAHLHRMLVEARTLIESHRRERLLSAPIDRNKIEEIARAVEAQILTAPAEIPFFREFRIVDVNQRPGSGETVTRRFGGFDRAEFTDPPMASFAPMGGFLGGAMKEMLANVVLRQLMRRKRVIQKVRGSPEDVDFWRDVGQAAGRAYPYATLLISYDEETDISNRLIRGRSVLKGIEVHQKPAEQRGYGNYLATVEGVDVFGVPFPVGTYILFSGGMLAQVSYTRESKDGPVVQVQFDAEQDPEKGTLTISVEQHLEWSREFVIELRGARSVEQPLVE